MQYDFLTFLAKFQSITNIRSHSFFTFISENLRPPLLDLVPRQGGGGGSYFSYILLNEIETMFSQLAKQSHWKLSADCSIAHEHIRPVDLPVNTFSNGNQLKKWQSKAKA